MAVEAKICGLTQPGDAVVAAAAGATYLGVVFASGARVITGERAAAIVTAARGTPVLGVFGRQSAEEIVRVCRAAGLRGAQLHEPHDRTTAAAIRAAGLLVWRVARLASPADLPLLDELALDADAVLVEPRVPHAAGGTGVALDLALAVEARRRLAQKRMVLAGGLTPDTVADAVALVRPEGVDVSSGVERQPGTKDPDKVARFLEAVFDHSSPI